MALSKEDKADVSRAYGKALANKVAKATRDKEMKKKYGGHGQGHFTANGGWVGNRMRGLTAKNTSESRSGFSGKDYS